jgi:zinc and cadmium transporter
MVAYLAFAAVAAAADVAGAILVTTAHKHRHAPLRYFVAAGAGFMLAAAFVRMLPESAHIEHAFLFVLLGYFGVHLFEHTVAPHFHFGEEVHHEALLRPSAGYLAVLGLGVHTLFDGVAIAAGFMIGPSLGVVLFLAVLVHERLDHPGRAPHHAGRPASCRVCARAVGGRHDLRGGLGPHPRGQP